MGIGRPDLSVVLAGSRFAVVAVADTGGESPELVEVGVLGLDDGALGDRPRTWLVRPERAITPGAVRVHGIGNGEVASAPTALAVGEQIRGAIGDRTVIAHRGVHCHALLSAALPGWTPPRVLDVRRLTSLAWPTSSQALGALVATARLTVPGTPGRARHDATATAQVFLAAVRRLNAPIERLADRATVVEGHPD